MKRILAVLGLAGACAACCAVPLVVPLVLPAVLGASGLGIALTGTQAGWLLGGALMLSGTWIAVRRRRAPGGAAHAVLRSNSR